MRKKVLLSTSFLAILFVVLGALLPSEYEVAAERTMNASPSQVHAVVSDLSSWETWSPWMDEDENMVIERQQDSGVGASQTWKSKTAGNGRLVFTSVDPMRGIDYDLFIEGFQKAKASIHYTPSPTGTRVTWVMSGRVDTPILGGYFATFLVTALKSQFDEGLEDLEVVIEEEANPRRSDEEDENSEEDGRSDQV